MRRSFSRHLYFAGKTTIVVGAVFFLLTVPLTAIYPPLFTSPSELAGQLLLLASVSLSFVSLGLALLLPWLHQVARRASREHRTEPRRILEVLNEGPGAERLTQRLRAVDSEPRAA